MYIEVIGMREGDRRTVVGKGTANPYHESQKYPEPTRCPRCGLVYCDGRWQAMANPLQPPFDEINCPACRREIDRYPGGLVRLRGAYLGKHREEIMNIVHNQTSAATAARPLQRIMWIDDGDLRQVEIAVTNGHLAMRIGKAITHACKGELAVKRADRDQLVRVYWEREE